MAHALGERLGAESIPGYFYEEAAKTPERRNLAHCRKGEYEGLKVVRPGVGARFRSGRIQRPHPVHRGDGRGCPGLPCRYNINLNTTSTRRANAVA